MDEFDCCNQGLTTLPKIPSDIKYVWCDNNNLTSLEGLPFGLIELDCSNNNLTCVSDLPNSLEVLWCENNNIENIEGDCIKELKCCGNKISTIELPNLIRIWCDPDVTVEKTPHLKRINGILQEVTSTEPDQDENTAQEEPPAQEELRQEEKKAEDEQPAQDEDDFDISALVDQSLFS